jgi:hypothetical protein
MFWAAGYKGIGLVLLNRCCIAHKAIFLSDLVTACERFLDTMFLVPPNSVYTTAARSRYVFPNKRPSRRDWKVWWDFWTSSTGHGGALHNPLGEWIALTHRIWEWHYCADNDTLYQ